MTGIATAIGAAISFAFAMSWEILWALVLGFGSSAIVQAVVSKSEMSRLLPDDSPRTLMIAACLGAASSSCSYAAVALARSIFRTGANFTAAMAFEFASTNLVIELGIIMVLLLGWQFTLAEFVGGLLMIAILAVLFKAFLLPALVREAREQAERGLVGAMEGHAEMAMSVTDGPLIQRIFSPGGFTAVSHSFVMDWEAIWRDIAGGLLLAGALAAWVPTEFWQRFFLVRHPVAALFWGPLVGPIVAMLSFVCSIGNVPLAAVLWNGGVSFGGVISFIFADLLIFPILNIYRKYYGGRMTGFLFVPSYAAMVAAGLVVELVFGALGLIPPERHAIVAEAQITFNYTSVLNLIFLALAALLVWRAVRTGVAAMLAEMDRPPAVLPAGMNAGTLKDELYSCPMHPEVTSDRPGRCPKCGMALEPTSEPAKRDASSHRHAPE